MTTTRTHERSSVHAPTRGERAFYACCRTIAVGLSRAVFVGRVLGAEHVPAEGPFILAPIHRSYVDWLVAARVTRRRLRFLVKGEVWKVRIVGRLLEALGAFAVQRGAADREALRQALEVLRCGEPLVVFPEGTRGTGAKVGPLREGAAYLALRAGVPVVPVGLAGVERAMPRGSVLVRPARVVVAVGPPILSACRDGDALGGPLRIPRSQTTALSEEIRAGIEAAQAVAEARLRGGAR